MVIKPKLKPFIGKWFIIEMEAWDQDYVNMEVSGHFQFGLVQGEMDCRMESKNGEDRIEFSWEGQEELDPASGRGWAEIENGELCGRIFIHLGDDSAFRARKARKGKTHE